MSAPHGSRRTPLLMMKRPKFSGCSPSTSFSGAMAAAKVLSDGEAYAASRDFPNHERYVQELVNYWGYDEREARTKDMSAMSWMAVPLADRAGVVGGVLFVDSTRRDFFSAPTRQRILLTSAIGIAKFAARRYTH